MTREEVLEKVLASDSLPTLSTVASRLISITAKEETTIGDIAELISKDISLSAKILKVVNSAFYSFPQQIGTIQQATSILGTNAVRSLVLSFSFLKPEQMQGEGFDYARFWERSLSEAVAARMLMAALDEEDTEEGFVAGLLQNLGVMILARTFAAKYQRVEKVMELKKVSRAQAERDILGADHAYIASQVAYSWGFPESLVAPLEFHHDPEAYAGGDGHLQMLCRVTALAGMLSRVFYNSNPEQLLTEFKEKSRKLLNIKESALVDLLERVHMEVEQTATFFDMKIENPKSIAEILQIANAELSVLNLSYEQMNRSLVEKTVQLEMLTKELEKKNRFLEKLAHIDGLTEVYNHRYFQNFLDQEINRAARGDHSLSLVMVDIDNFKKFNDSYGHQVGDEVLKQFCAVAGTMVREYDILARYGGEEFALVLPETDLEEACIVAEKIRREISSHTFKSGLEVYSITASFGVATMQPAVEKMKKDALISNADEALYTAKKKGRNRVEAYRGKKRWFGK